MKINKAITEAVAAHGASIRSPKTIAADPQCYVHAVDEMNRCAEEHDKIMNELDKKAEKILPRPKQAMADYSKYRAPLSESAFDVKTEALNEGCEAKKIKLTPKFRLGEKYQKKPDTLEELPADVYTVIYDRLFSGNLKKRPLIAMDVNGVYPAERFSQDNLKTHEIGVYLSDKKDAELAEKVADEMIIRYELKEIPEYMWTKDDNGNVWNKYIAILRIPEKTAEMSFRDYIKEMDLGDYKDFIPASNAPKRK